MGNRIYIKVPNELGHIDHVTSENLNKVTVRKTDLIFKLWGKRKAMTSLLRFFLFGPISVPLRFLLETKTT